MNCLRQLGSKLFFPYFARDVANHVSAYKSFSSFMGVSLFNNTAISTPLVNPNVKTNLNLTPSSSLFIQTCGLKYKRRLKLRCKHCYYANLEGILYVLCDVYPRHKQRMLGKKKKKYELILSHACMSKYRPY